MVGEGRDFEYNWITEDIMSKKKTLDKFRVGDRVVISGERGVETK